MRCRKVPAATSCFSQFSPAAICAMNAMLLGRTVGQVGAFFLLLFGQVIKSQAPEAACEMKTGCSPIG